MPAGLMMIIGAAFSCYILFFLNAAGAWMQELMKPYIYLVPASGFTKLVWAAMSTMLKPVVDGVIVFAILGIYAQANPLTVLLCILVYASMGVLYIAGSVLSDRILGTVANKGLIMILYMLILLLLVCRAWGFPWSCCSRWAISCPRSSSGCRWCSGTWRFRLVCLPFAGTTWRMWS